MNSLVDTRNNNLEYLYKKHMQLYHNRNKHDLLYFHTYQFSILLYMYYWDSKKISIFLMVYMNSRNQQYFNIPSIEDCTKYINYHLQLSQIQLHKWHCKYCLRVYIQFRKPNTLLRDSHNILCSNHDKLWDTLIIILSPKKPES